jgi:membrane metallo-endopeptidase-like protein 1
MASRRSTYEIAALIFVTIILIVLLVLVGITFNKVNNPPKSEGEGSGTTENPHETTTSPGAGVSIPYDGAMDTAETWDDQLADPESEIFNETKTKYQDLITASLVGTYPGVTTIVNKFQENPPTLLDFKVQVDRKSADDDGTVKVDFTTYIPYEKGTTPPPDSAIETTINDNINQTACDGCNVTSIVIITTTPNPTTVTTPHSKGTEGTERTTRSPLDPAVIAAEYILSNLDDRYNPCEDFYHFACGNFTNNHPVRHGAVGYGTFDIVQDRVGDIILLNLHKINLSDPDLEDWRSKTRRFYDNCKHNQSLDDNKLLLKYINDIGGWPMIMESDTWNEKKFTQQLPTILANLTSTFSVQTLVSADIDLDWKDSSRYLIQLDQSTLALGNPEFYTHVKFRDDREDYVEMIRQTAAILTYDQDMPQHDERVKIAAQEILDFETLLAKHIVTEDQRQNYTDMYNPMEVQTIHSQYPFMDWQTYFNVLTPKEVSHPYNRTTNIVEPKYLQFLTETIFKKTPMKTIANYLVWRLVYSLSSFVDDDLRQKSKLFRTSTMSKGVSGSRTERDDECITLIINNLGFAASRLLIEGSLDENELNNAAVKNMTAGLREAFKGQLDTLFWMDEESRNYSKTKLDDYVELAGFPNWIEDSNKLNDYYKDLVVWWEQRNFLKNYVSAMTFHETSRFRVLADPKVRRETWIMPPAIVNAWYQPDFNSITFPSGILRPPFFRHDFPTAVNYGALGTVIGHEMTHGFDDQGVQFDATGYLQTWMTLHSRIGFKRMVDCVIRQYNRTCFPEVDMCIDGVQTQGENTADNGGIREAYNAYRLYVNKYGEEPPLPNLKQFSMDQIFFLSFANVWCGDYETREYLENQLVTNVHSPPPARVLNTLKNFDEFGKVFQCTPGQPYYPFRSEVCYVWDSPAISNKTEYKTTADRLLKSMKDTVRPCDDFFEHACGNYTQDHPLNNGASINNTIIIVQNEIYQQIIDKFDNDTFMENATTSIKNAKIYFDVCRHANDTERINNTEVLDVINKLGGWPALNTTDFVPPSDYGVSYVSKQVGYLAGTYGVQTLLVSSATVDPGDTTRSVIAIDQSSLALGAQQYYTDDKLQNVTAAYQNLILNVTRILSSSIGHELTYQAAFGPASSIANFEKRLAHILRPDTDRLNFTKLYNIYNLTDANSTFSNDVDLPTYLKALVASSPNLVTYFSPPNDAPLIISEPHFINRLAKFITEELQNDNSIIQNYIVWRFIYARLNFMDDKIKQLYTDFRLLKQDSKALPLAETDCVAQLTSMLGYTVGRLDIDDLERRGDEWMTDASKMISNITDSFNQTIPNLDWMDRKSQEGAHTKVNNMFKNTAYPDWIKDDKQLDDYYANYKISSDSTYFDVFNQLNQYAMAKSLESILQPVRRHDFQMSPAVVNAWYNPTLNSLTVPAGFLNPPFYHPEYPTSVKYGAIGAVMGHELTHAFDDSGIQFNGNGLLDLWMTEYSRKSYDTNVVGCVVNEYDHYCHFDGEFCVNGTRTQGENIADNGGIRQAFNAYRNHISEELKQNNHSGELLPGMEWYTQDQLFFLSYAQLWCGSYSDQYTRRELLTDVHSPGVDRVKGVMQNFEEFSKAFQCEVGQPMDPEDKCYVWADPVDTTEGYDKAAKGILESLDPSTRPCDDFYQYACGGWINRHPIPKHASAISTNSLSEDAVLLATTDAITNVDQNDEKIPEAFKKTQQMYNFCAGDLSDVNSTSLESFITYVNEELYEWPIITKYWSPKLNASKQIFEVAAKLGGLGVPVLLNAYPQPDYDTAEKYALYLDQGNLLLGNRELYLDDQFADVMTKYKDVLVLTAVKFASKYNKYVPIENIISDAEQIIAFETTLARLSVPDALLENYTTQDNQYNNKTELSDKYPNLDFDTYLKELLPSEVNKPSNRYKIIVSEPSFLEGLNAALPYVDPRVVQNYLIWRYIIDSASLLGNDMKAILRDFKQKTEFVEDLRDDIATCTQDTIALLPYAAGRLYVEKAFGSDRQKIEDEAKTLVEGIVDQFKQRLRKLKWLDTESLLHAEEKLSKLVENIGYPEWTFNNTELDDLYYYPIDVSKDYYTTKRNVTWYFYQTKFLVLDQNINVSRYNFQMSPAIQNAWYQPWLNSLTIPAGEIQIPFFDMGYPSAVNFGGLGAVAGHELTHGFDDDGVQFGPTGKLDYWISPESAAYFTQNISQCVVDQYDQYCYDDLPSGKLCINGKVTQGENIADNGGTKTAFNAYVEWVRVNGYEALLPGLEDFTMDQIFFLNFARSWCGAIKPEALEKQLLLDVHSPARDRVIGTLSNMKEFHVAFQCKKGDKMYPEHPCNVW